jgi:hypothetical protein
MFMSHVSHGAPLKRSANRISSYEELQISSEIPLSRTNGDNSFNALLSEMYKSEEINSIRAGHEITINLL